MAEHRQLSKRDIKRQIAGFLANQPTHPPVVSASVISTRRVEMRPVANDASSQTTLKEIKTIAFIVAALVAVLIVLYFVDQWTGFLSPLGARILGLFGV